MKILFITGLYTDLYKESLSEIEKTYIQNAPNVFQWAVVDGLIKNHADFEILSYPFMPCYPTYSKRYICAESIRIDNNICGKIMKYSTIPVIKNISISCSIKKYIEKEIACNPKEKYVVLAYTPLSYFIEPIIALKRKYSNIMLATIVTDLIDDVNNYKANNNLFKSAQLKLERFFLRRNYKDIDKYILLSERMLEKIPEAKDRYIVLEGITAEKDLYKKRGCSVNKILLYTGTLEEYSGVRELIIAFHKIKNDRLRLVICGVGPLKSFIEEFIKKDCRIIFKGLVTHDEAIRLQRDATLLINPRIPDNSITRYSFPSKTMEYLSSGTPMIGYKLDGIPMEYYEYYYTIDALDEDSLANSIQKVMELPKEVLDLKAKSAYDFVMQNKTAKMQVKRMLDFIINTDAKTSSNKCCK